MTTNPEHAAGSMPVGDVAQPQYGEAAEGPPQASSTPRAKARLAGQLAMIFLGIVAGAVGAEVIHYTQDLLPRPALEGLPPYPPKLLAAADRAYIGSTAIGFALAGALVAAALGGGLWLLRGAARPAVRGAMIGLLAGAVLGALGGALNILMDRQIAGVEMDDLFRAMLVHFPFWMCLGIAVGVTVGLPRRDVSTAKAIGAAFGAAVIASLLYPLLSMLLFPAARTEMVVPFEFGSRVLRMSLGAGLLAWAAARSVPRST